MTPRSTDAFKPYQNTQIGWILLLVLLVIYVITAPLEPDTPVLEVILLAVALLFSTLTIHVEDQRLIWFFGPVPLIRKHTLIAEIASCAVVRNKWWWGFGIRFHPWGQWLYNISGLDAVEVTLKSGKRFRLGTDEPKRLKQAIDSAVLAHAGH